MFICAKLILYHFFNSIFPPNCNIAVEMEHWFQSESIDFCKVEPQALDTFKNLDSSAQNILLTHPGSLSGGYAYHVFVYAAKELIHTNNAPVQFQPVK